MLGLTALFFILYKLISTNTHFFLVDSREGRLPLCLLKVLDTDLVLVTRGPYLVFDGKLSNGQRKGVKNLDVTKKVFMPSSK